MTEEGENHLLELSKLAEKDPEFFKYLQENDRELLEFDPDALATDICDEETEGSDRDAMEEDDKLPVLTRDILSKWQKALLKVLDLGGVSCFHFTTLFFSNDLSARCEN